MYVSHKHIYWFALFLLLLIPACQEEQISIGTNVSDTFCVENAGASMRVLVQGNTASKTYILMVHGGPGSSSYWYNTNYIREHLGSKYALIYWDQRNAGASQGNNNAGNLHLSVMTEDLKKVIQVVKYRYGSDIKLFLMGHSFGGLLTTSFLCTGANQSMVNGWIFADGSHTYPLNDTLTRNMLFKVGEEQVALGRHFDDWSVILNYCAFHTGNFSYDESNQLESYAADAETYMPQVNQVDWWSILKANALKDDWPLSSILCNYLYSSSSDLNKELATTQFTSSLPQITVPTLVLVGQYDFICPKALADDLYNRIGSTDKQEYVSSVSGHNIFIQDEAFFCDKISAFVEAHK